MDDSEAKKLRRTMSECYVRLADAMRWARCYDADSSSWDQLERAVEAIIDEKGKLEQQLLAAHMQIRDLEEQRQEAIQNSLERDLL